MAYRYQGNSNVGLVTIMEEDELFSCPRIKGALLKVPRGDFVPEQYMDEAYMDRPLRIEELGFNISAPHMYAFCLEHLDLKPGLSFLDVGSGCGHMTALGGYLVGSKGKSHGVEILEPAVDMARQSVRKVMEKGVDLSHVTFEKRNVFIPDPEFRRWDRIHVGASCPHREKHRLYELLNPGGLLVMPIGSSFVKAEKDMFGMTKETKLLDVRYGELILPTPEEIAEAEKMRSMQVVLPESSLSRDYIKMFNNKLLSDVAFLVDGKELHAHKAILASRCDYFASLYSSGMKDASASEVHVTGYSYEAFHEFLRFIYTDGCEVPNPRVAAELMSASEFYRIDRLKALMELLLSRAIDVESACPILEIAHRFGAEQLKRCSFEFILSNYDEVCKTNGFSDMHKDCVTEILHVAVQRLKAP